MPLPGRVGASSCLSDDGGMTPPDLPRPGLRARIMYLLFPQLEEVRRTAQEIKKLKEQVAAIERGDIAPESDAEFKALVREKRLAVAGLISLSVNIGPDSNREEVRRLVAGIIDDLSDSDTGTGAAALTKAQFDVAMHLLRALAEERGEPVDITWQREAMELTREASGE
jgi:hypothetical protein